MKGGVETKRIGRGSGDTEEKFESADTRAGMGIGREAKKEGGLGEEPRHKVGERNRREQSLRDTVE